MSCKKLVVLLFGLIVSGCATNEASYSGRNNLDAARSRCIDLARTMGYRDVTVDAIDKDGQAEWNVKLVMRREGKERKERCEYNARTDRVHIDD